MMLRDNRCTLISPSSISWSLSKIFPIPMIFLDHAALNIYYMESGASKRSLQLPCPSLNYLVTLLTKGFHLRGTEGYASSGSLSRISMCLGSCYGACKRFEAEAEHPRYLWSIPIIPTVPYRSFVVLVLISTLVSTKGPHTLKLDFGKLLHRLPLLPLFMYLASFPSFICFRSTGIPEFSPKSRPSQSLGFHTHGGGLQCIRTSVMANNFNPPLQFVTYPCMTNNNVPLLVFFIQLTLFPLCITALNRKPVSHTMERK